MIWYIAWRNVWRNKLRSLIIMAAVTVGLTGGILYYAFMLGMMQQRINAAISNEVSNIQLHHPKFLLNQELSYSIENAENILKKIELIQGVKAACSRIKTTAMASTAETGTGIILSGINPEKEKQVTRLFELVIEGKYPDNKDRIPILIGKKLAEKLNARVGSKIVITIANTMGIITYGAFRVSGIYHSENDLFDGVNVFVRQKDLADLVNFNANNANELAVLLDDNEQTESITRAMEKQFAALIAEEKFVVRPWYEIEPTLNALIEMMDIFAYVFLAIILIALAFGIVNTMLMAVMERVREIGMLMSIGMNKIRIFGMIMLESIFLSVVGGIIGISISIFAVGYFQQHGMDLSKVGEGYNSLGYSSVVYFEAETSFYIITTLLVIITAIISSVYPARKALKLKPAEAIRENE